MIVSDDHNFIYIHIPKCGGSTIREWLRQRGFAIDPRFDGYADIPKIGVRHSAHLPLNVLEEYFPEILNKIRNYRTIAIVRDPLSRFRSSFAQYQREFFYRKPEAMSQREINSQLLEICDRISGGGIVHDPKLMHFQRQSDFVFLHGEQVVTDLYPIERLNDLIETLAKEFMIFPPSGPSVNVRRCHRIPLFAHALNRAKRGAQALLPCSIWRPMHDLGLRLLTKNSSDKDLDLPDSVTDFVTQYYSDDFVLYRSAQECSEPRFRTSSKGVGPGQVVRSAL